MPVVRKKKTSNHQRDWLPIFQFHGLDFSVNGSDQATADCPFCGKESHFYCNIETGQWDCKVCGESGNAYSFLRKLLEANPASKTDRARLAEYRKLPKGAFDKADIGYDEILERFLFPVYSPENPGSLVGLRSWEPNEEVKTPVITTTGLPHHLLHGHRLNGQGSQVVYLCEGDWDCFAMEWLRQTLDEEVSVVGSPGAHVFKREWVNFFKGKDVFLCYDADSAGQSGQSKVQGLLASVANSVQVLLWPASSPEGYDLSDFVSKNANTPKTAWKELHKLFSPAVSSPSNSYPADSVDQDDPPPKTWDKIPSYEQLVKEFDKFIYMDRHMKDALAISLATVSSIRMPGDPVWMFLVATPGAGKTLFLRSMMESPLCQFESNLRPHALVSGMILEGGGRDPSLIPQLKGRALVLKDYTEIRSQDRSNQEQIYGILRGAYDGHVHVIFGNGKVADYEGWFAMLAGVTHEIHGDNRASLGERFLKCELIGEAREHNSDNHIRGSIKETDVLSANEVILRDKTAAFLSRKVDIENLPSVPRWVVERVVGLVQVIAHLRASVCYARKGELEYRPRIEIGTRLAKQLIKLGRSLALIFDKKTIDKECYRLMEKVGFDTSYGFPLEIFRAIMSKHPKPATITSIIKTTGLSNSTIHRSLTAMQEIGTVIRTRLPKNSPGQPEYGYKGSTALVKHWRKAKISR
jgi:ribosomal protein L37AE/L43A